MVRLRLWPTAAGPLERRHDRRDHGRHTELEEGAGGVPRCRPPRAAETGQTVLELCERASSSAILAKFERITRRIGNRTGLVSVTIPAVYEG